MKYYAKVWISVLLMAVCASTLDAKQNEDNVIVVINARLIDGTGAEPVDGAVIVIKDGRFQLVGKNGAVATPDGATVIDAKGKTVVPGLIDAHYHMNYPKDREEPFILDEALCSYRAAFHLRRHLMGGITTVLDAGSYHNSGVMAKKAFEEGLLVGSRPIVVAERINAPGGHGVSRFDMAYEAEGMEGFREGVRVQVELGADVIKILPHYTREELKAGIAEAHRLGRKVAVHSGYRNNMDYIRWAAELDCEVIMHSYALPDDVIAMMGKKGIYSVPTLEILLKLHQGARYRKNNVVLHPYEEIFLKLRKAGVKTAIGTDAIYEYMMENPGHYFDEVERFVKNGCTPMEAIVAATKIGAEVCDAADRLGTIEKGKLADLLILDKDPLAEIKNLREVNTIIQEGKIIKSKLAR